MKKIKSVDILINEDLKELEISLNESLSSEVSLATEISNYMISSGGKRIRPLISILIARSLGYSGNKLIDLATAIELLHTATLIHDDVVDNSKIRRGKPSVNKKWDIMHSVLVGDFVYSKAFQKMSLLKNPDIINILANSTNKISEGEVMQLALKKTFLSEKDYFKVIGRKTAELFKAAAISAAVLSNATLVQQNLIKELAFSLGIIFQINDDLLDYFGDSLITGKQPGQDLLEGKVTLPLIKAFKLSGKENQRIIKLSLKKLNEEKFSIIKKIIQDSGALEETIRIRDNYTAIFQKNISLLPKNNFRDYLKETGNEIIEINF